jgi:hypothetical protein
MPITYDNIATQTLGSAAASITFSSIPSTYTDLRLVFVGLGDTAGGVTLRFNSDSGANYSSTNLQGNGTSTSTAANTGNSSISVAGVNTNLRTVNPLLLDINIFSYAGATNKTLLSLASGDNNGSGGTLSVVGLWRNTTAINTVAIFAPVNFSSGATATLYGIKNA